MRLAFIILHYLSHPWGESSGEPTGARCISVAQRTDSTDDGGARKRFLQARGVGARAGLRRGASTAVQALLANQIDFIFSVGPQMPAVWEGADIMLLAQQVGRPTFSRW